MNATRRGRSLTLASLESLDERLAPSAFGTSAFLPHHNPTTVPTPPPIVHNATTIPKAAPLLNTVYQEFLNYQNGGSKGAFVSSLSNVLQIQGTSVGVHLRVSGNVDQVVAQMKSLGMQVQGTVNAFGIIEGTVPISKLPTVASNGQVLGLTPIFRPTLNMVGHHAY